MATKKYVYKLTLQDGTIFNYTIDSGIHFNHKSEDGVETVHLITNAEFIEMIEEEVAQVVEGQASLQEAIDEELVNE